MCEDRKWFVAGVKHLLKIDESLTQKVIAKRAGISPPYVSQLLGQESRGPFSAYVKIARACGHTLSEVLEIGKAVSNDGGQVAEPLLAKEVERLQLAVQALSETIKDNKKPPIDLVPASGYPHEKSSQAS